MLAFDLGATDAPRRVLAFSEAFSYAFGASAARNRAALRCAECGHPPPFLSLASECTMLLDAFMTFEEPTLDGESTDATFPKAIEILSFEQTVIRSRPVSAVAKSDSGQGKSEHSAITLIKPLDKSSPKLLQAACAGTLYKKVVISLCQPSGTTKTSSDKWKKIAYLTVTLTQAHISRVHLVADPALHKFGRLGDFPLVAGNVMEMGPLEEVDITYQQIEWMYKGGTGTLNISGSWNLGTNSAK